ncbi:MAG: hypothetical protein NT076_04940 [Candidatus Pacearchaeota archaeon]|nr:hypothetical protein [Candidatus Pacearchaeota archaeon]
MDKVWILISIILLASFVGANSAYQQVIVNVVPGFLNINSPTNQIYQTNRIILNFSVITGSNKVKDVWLIEGKNLEHLCSKCTEYSKETYFSNGYHQITIKSEFFSGEFVQETVNFYVDSSSDVYILNNNVLKKATAKDIVNYLFNYNFSLVYKNELTPEDSCSINAKNGNATFNGEGFGNNNKLSFYSILSMQQGQGSFSAQMSRKRLSFNFKVKETIENSETTMKLLVIDSTGGESTIELNKMNKTIIIIGNNLSIKDMKVSSIEGCGAKRSNFYFLENNGKQTNSIEDVRKTLIANPIFVGKYEGLKYLFEQYWRIHRVFNWW